MSADILLDVTSANPPWRINVTATTMSIDFEPSDPASCAAIAERIDRLLERAELEALLWRYVVPLSYCKLIVASVGDGSCS